MNMMFGPLSGKQQREWAKHFAKEQRETAKQESEESRKQELHEIKLQEAAAKANQGIAHKEDVHGAKMKELGAPLGSKQKLNREKLGLPSTNPLADTGVFGRGHHTLPGLTREEGYANGTDTVPAMLTPGEAVIPRAAAQDPKNKAAIKRMVSEGREANRQKYSAGTTNVKQKGVRSDLVIPPIPHINRKGFFDGSTGVGLRLEDMYRPEDQTGIAPNGLRYMESSTDQVTPKGDGYMGAIPVPQDNAIATEQSASDEKGQYPLLVPTLSREEVDQVNSGQEVPQSVVEKATAYRNMRESQGQSPFADRVSLKVPVGAADQLYQEGQVPQVTPKNESPVVAKPNVYDVEDARTVPAVNETTNKAVPKPVDKTDPNYWVTQLKSVSKDIDEAADKHGKDQEGFVDSFKNIFSYKGLKDILGLNNQEVARMAVTYLGGRARGFDGARSLSYAGKVAFETSLQRQGREGAEKAANKRMQISEDNAIKRTAVQMAIHESDKIAAEKKETLALNREERNNYERDYNDYTKMLAGDVSPAVRQKAMGMIRADASNLAEARAQLKQATEYLAANTIHKDPNAGPRWTPHWEPYRNSNGQIVQAARMQDGRLMLPGGSVVGPNDLFHNNVYDSMYKDTAENVASVIPKVQPAAAGKKDKDLTQSDRVNVPEIKHAVTLAGIEMTGTGKMSPPQFAAAAQGTIQDMVTAGQPINKDNFLAKFTTDKTIQLRPTDKALFNSSKSSGEFKLPDTKAAIEFGSAIRNSANSANKSDDQIFDGMKAGWKQLDPQAQQRIASITRPGYSPMMEYGLYLADPSSKVGEKIKKIVEPNK
jgi:hypothetical protein